MALHGRELQQIPEWQERYLDILVDEYNGYIPGRELREVAERLGVNVTQLRKLNSGSSKSWDAEREKRLACAVALRDKNVRLAALQEIYEDRVAQRKQKGLTISSKDPIEILDQIRKETNLSGTTNIQQNVAIQFVQSMSDDELAANIRHIEEAVRSGLFLKESDVIEAEWNDTTANGSLAPGIEGGADTTLYNEGQEQAEE